jgi:hypothetical protein
MQVIYRLIFQSLVVGFGLGIAEWSSQSVTLVGFLIFLGGLVWTARYCVTTDFSDLYGSLFNYGAIAFTGFLPYTVITEPSHPVAASAGNILQQWLGTTLFYAIGAGFAWTFLVVLLTMGYIAVREQRVGSDGPPSLDDW